MKNSSHCRITLLVFVTSILLGQIPQTMSYQGVLKTNSGALVSDGNYQIVFKLYDVSTSGTALWSETQATVAVSNGIFNVSLGSVTAMNLAFDKQYWLGVTVGSDSELSPRIKLNAAPYSLNSLAVLGSSNTFPSSGNVGIGTTSPSSLLDVNGAMKTTDLTIEKSTDSFTILRLRHTGLTAIDAFNLQVESSGFGQKISFARSDSPYTRYFTIDASNQRVGILTMNPKNTLDVEGSVAIGASYSGTSTAPTNGLIVEGNVGIGTTSPGNLLHLSVNDATADTITDVLQIEHTTTGTPANHIGAGVTFHIEDGGGSEEQGRIDVLLDDVTNTAEDATMAFKVNQNGTMSEVMRIDGTSGNVGVGSKNPSEKLDVSGNVNITGQIKMGDMSSVNKIDVVSSGGVSFSNTTAYSRATAPAGGLIISGNVGIGTTSPNSKLEVSGSFATSGINIISSSGSYTLTSTDYIILASHSSSSLTLTLPTAGGITGRKYIIKRMGDGVVYIYPSNSETIDGTSSFLSLANKYNWIEVISDGTNWVKIGAG